MGSLAGAYQPPITASTSSVTAVEEIPGGDDGSAHTSIDPRGVVALSDNDMAGQTLATIAAFSTGVPTNDTDQLTAYTHDANGDTLTQTAIEPLTPTPTPNQITPQRGQNAEPAESCFRQRGQRMISRGEVIALARFRRLRGPSFFYYIERRL